ncbi:4-amino-4-deoxy-L-arabinose transferase-like glycosyltransferase [Sphingomonas kyeonggiensis]|uniref:4-amino-4-deoxy-L-arabinose transferase-like glycosyltransferase n=1 Tax=Sphingomonas kyeonggiensis TaxID=1268553 RepID=A0A7W7K407_9SPHN|nr:glycosyltransferase family 39 protein [Sphingomonas kyeonggiensis]MBB4840231.1 4-amino-4-deoxy-L-arabinose transferase-like glycosyltransferase [Sphingomonas kyeonggiensis]
MQHFPARTLLDAPRHRPLRLVEPGHLPWTARVAAATRVWASNPALLAALLLVVAIAARAAQFGNPVVQVDDEFYLLTGDRMLHGALPYVDIWDRKPIGLFLIYAAIRLLGGEGVLAYQLVATLFAVATAFVIARIARNLAGPHGAAAAGVVYILYLGIFGGEGGQSPVFYNLFVALAAWAMTGIVRRPGFDWLGFAGGLGVMLLIGAAMQVKYTALFEGVFFGLALLWFAGQRGAGRGALVAMGAAWIAAALLPTLAAWGWYAAIGQGDAFVQANFLSILERSSDGTGIVLKRLGWMALLLAPLGIAAWLGRGMARPVSEDVRKLLDGWAIAAIGGVLLFGTFFDHYALPLVAPLCVLAAAWFGDGAAGLVLASGRTRWRIPAGVAMMALIATISLNIVNDNRRDRGWGPQVERMADYIRPQLRDCLYVFDGEPALYRLTGSCLPTRWPFPSHLSLTRESRAIGVDPMAEVKRIMAARPEFVVASTRPDRDLSPEVLDYMTGLLARDYAPALEVPVGSRSRIVYRRRAGA